MPDCPPDTDLAGFLEDSLPPERAAGLSAHVDKCPDCQSRLDRLTQDTEGAVARYKALSSVIKVGPPASGVASGPEAGTLIVGVNPIPPPLVRLTGLPRVPGFDVIAEIGRGGMGVVYKARHRRLNRLVALKMVIAGGAADTKTVQRFLFEAEVLARVQHPQVVQVFEVDTYSGQSGVPIPYLAMELLEGGSLSRRLREGGALAPRAAAELMEGVARAVHAAHLQGVVHRDLKPGNILFGAEIGVRGGEAKATVQAPPDSALRPSGSGQLPKVTDFGLAKFSDSGADLTGSGQVVGTPHYMAPEQAAGGKSIGPPADVYGLGALLFECLTGRPPFEGSEPMSVLLKVVNENPPDVRSLRPEVPRDLAAVTARCLDKDPRRRYPTAADLADDLRRFLDNLPTVARPLRRRERAWLWAKRNPAVAGLAAALAVVLAVAFALVTWLWVKAEQTAAEERRAKNDVMTAKGRAVANAEEAMRQKANADHRQAELEFSRAVTRCEEGRVREGLGLFVEAVRLAEATGDADLGRVARVNLAAWPRELPSPPRLALAHTAQPRLAAFHPDGRHVVTAGLQEELYLWDLTDGRKVRAYKPAATIRPPIALRPWTAATYWTVAVSRDGNTIATGGSDGRITVWNTGSPEPRVVFQAVEGWENVWSVAFAPDGTLWAADGRGPIRRWDLAAAPRPVPVAQLGGEGVPHIVHVIVVSPDGKRLYAGGRATVARVWDTATKAELRHWPVPGWVQDLAVSPDETRLAVTGPDAKARVIDLTDRFPPFDIDLGGAYGNGVAFAPKRPVLVTSDGDGSVRFWHRDTGQPVGIPLRLSGEVTRVRFRPDSDEMAVPAGDAVHLCGVPDPPGDLVSSGRRKRVRGLDFSPAGDRLAATDDDGVEVFDTHTLRRVQSADNPGEDPLTLRYDPDPSRPRVIRGHRGGFDELAVPDGRRARDVRTSQTGRIRRVGFTPGGAGLLVMGEALVCRYDPATLDLREAVKPAEDIPAGVNLEVMAVRPDGGEVLVAYGRRALFLHPDTLKPIRPGWEAADEILDAAYTPDGRRVLVGRRDSVAELLDAATGTPTVRPMSHAGAVAAVAVDPRGKVFLTGSRDGTGRFWDAATGLPLGAPLLHLGPVTHAACSPDGEHAATGTGTGHVVLWDVPPPPAAGSLDELRERVARRR